MGGYTPFLVNNSNAFSSIFPQSFLKYAYVLGKVSLIDFSSLTPLSFRFFTNFSKEEFKNCRESLNSSVPSFIDMNFSSDCAITLGGFFNFNFARLENRIWPSYPFILWKNTGILNILRNCLLQ